MEGHARPLSLKEINILKNKDARRSQRASMEQPGNSEKQGPRQPMHLLLTTREGRLCSPCHCSDKIPVMGLPWNLLENWLPTCHRGHSGRETLGKP